MKITKGRNRWRVHLSDQEAHARLLAIDETRQWMDSSVAGRWRCYSSTPWISETVLFFDTLDDASLFKLTFEGTAGDDAT